MKFPLIKKSGSSYPKKCICPICKKKWTGDFVVITGGCMKPDGPDSAGMFREGESICFLDITAHLDSVELYTNIYLVDHTEDNGQFDIYFCSTECLRKFFTQWVDALDKNIKKYGHK